MLIAVGANAQSTDTRIAAPRFWNDRELADWATPVAGLNVRPGHFSERDYYAAPSAEWVRTYPVYFPGREPTGYFVPTGFKGVGVTHRAIPGHEFGLKLSAEEKAALIAFLKTL
jgi:hypothetical protein